MKNLGCNKYIRKVTPGNIFVYRLFLCGTSLLGKPHLRKSYGFLL